MNAVNWRTARPADDRAERALYASQDCGGAGAMRARGRIADRLAAGKQPRMRDVIALEDAARMSGNDLPNWRTQRPAARRSRVADFFWRMAQAFRAIPGGEPSNWRDAAVFGIGAAWGGMIAIGILLAIAARHAP